MKDSRHTPIGRPELLEIMPLLLSYRGDAGYHPSQARAVTLILIVSANLSLREFELLQYIVRKSLPNGRSQRLYVIVANVMSKDSLNEYV